MAPVTRSTASAGPDAVLQRVANLPVDIIATICDNADPSVLKQLRLVSKSTNSLAEPSLFRIVKLAITAQSRDRIVKISNSEKLQKQVRVLVYDNRLLPWALDYNQWKERVLTDPGYFFEDREGANFPRVEFSTSAAWRTNAAYQNYCDLLEDQKNWHRGSFEEDWLTERFRTLPNLDSLFLETGVWKPEPTVHLVQDAATNFAILHEKARRTLSFVGRMSWLEPGFQPIEESEETMKPGLNQFHAKRLKALLNASTCSKKLIRSLSIEWLDLHQMNEKFERPMSCTQERFMLGLSHLSIRLADFGCSLEAWDHAAFIIAYASNITDLTIEGSSSRSHLKGRQERVDSLFDKHFPKLRSIHIGGLWIDAEAFEKFLKLHSEIRKIDLKEVHLAKGQQTIANEYEDGHYGTLQIPHYPTLHASRQELWSEVIKFLKDLRMAYVDVWLMADGQLKRRDDIVSYIKGTAPRPLCAYL